MPKRLIRSHRQKAKPPGPPIPGWQKKLVGTFLGVMIMLVGVDSFLKPQSRARKVSAGPLPKVKSLSQEERFRLATDRVLSEFGIRLNWVEEHEAARHVRLPKEIDALLLYQSLVTSVRELDGSVTQGKENLRTGETELAYSFKGKALGTIRLMPDARLSRLAGRIALIIDDFGYRDDEMVKAFLNLKFPVTYAVIPGLPHSSVIAARLDRRGKAVIVHMPMEALDAPVERNGFELLVTMPPAEIRSRVRKALAAVPNAEGMNNHMGSRATQNDTLLTAVFVELKQAGLFFVDSRTTNDTRAFELARKQGLLAALNDTFLDSIEEERHVRQKLWHLADVAAERGAAIGIGHPRRATLKALLEIAPQLQLRGFEFVPVGNLIRQHATNLAVSAKSPIVRRN